MCQRDESWKPSAFNLSMDSKTHVHPENESCLYFFFLFNMKSKCSSTSFVLTVWKYWKQKNKSWNQENKSPIYRWRWTEKVCFIRGIWSQHEHLGIVMESLHMESIFTGAHINPYLAAKGLWEKSKTSQTKCLPVPGDNIWTMLEITF